MIPHTEGHSRSPRAAAVVAEVEPILARYQCLDVAWVVDHESDPAGDPVARARRCHVLETTLRYDPVLPPQWVAGLLPPLHCTPEAWWDVWHVYSGSYRAEPNRDLADLILRQALERAVTSR